jgi:hypothetical protein
MEKEFIPYEQALSLKELGFDEPCIGFYTQNAYGSTLEQKVQYWREPIGGNDDYVFVLAPLYQQAFRFFRERYGLHIVINVGIPHDNITHSKRIQYFFNVVKCGKHHKGIFRSIFYPTYEEAELECLKKLIEIVENK